MAKTNQEIALSIIKKCGYWIDFDPYELDDDGEEILPEDGGEEGYFWQDGDGNKGEYFESEDEAIDDCIQNLDWHDIKLTKAEIKYMENL